MDCSSGYPSGSGDSQPVSYGDRGGRIEPRIRTDRHCPCAAAGDAQPDNYGDSAFLDADAYRHADPHGYGNAERDVNAHTYTYCYALAHHNPKCYTYPHLRDNSDGHWNAHSFQNTDVCTDIYGDADG